MNNYLTKVAHILPVYLAVSLLTSLGLLLFRYIFSIWLQVFELKEDLWIIWLPIAAGTLLIGFLLGPKVKILTFKKRTDDRRYMVLVLASIGVIGPAMFLQHSAPKALASLTELNSVQQVPILSADKYYSIREYGVVSEGRVPHVDVRRTGRHGENLDVDVYFAFPMTSGGEALSRVEGRWYGVKFRKRIKNRLADHEKDRQYRDFLKECFKKVANYKFGGVSYFERVPHSDELDGYRKSIIETGDRLSSGELAVFEGVKEPFEYRSGADMSYALWIFVFGLIVFLALLAWPDINQSEIARQKRGGSTRRLDKESLVWLFVPRDGHFVSAILINLVLLAFIVMVFSGVNAAHPTATELLEWGGNRREDTMSGEWWRLFSCLFVHSGFMHLFGNLFGLVLGGILVEDCMQRYKFVLIYFGAGLCGSLASIWWHENTVSVGASGAILGLFGAQIVLSWLGKTDSSINRMAGLYIGLNLLFGLFGFVDNAAHIGGLLGGALLAFLLHLPLSKTQLERGQEIGDKQEQQ